MRAAVFLGNRQSSIADTAPPEPGPGQVLVRLAGCGVCASSLPVWQGRPWFRYPLDAGAPGHEPWGTVAAVGEGVQGLDPGQWVTGLTGRAYAEYDLASATELVPLPAWLEGRPFPGEALACVMNIWRRAEVSADTPLAIVGAGFLGLALVQIAVAEGIPVTAFSRRSWSLRRARELGATAAELASAGAAGGDWPRVIECTGTQAGLDAANGLVGAGGRLVIAGYHQDGPRTVPLQDWNWKGIDVINAHERDPRVVTDGVRAAITAIADGRLDVRPLLSCSYALDGLDGAFRCLESRPDGFVKAVVLL